MANLPFVGSDVLGSAACMDKDVTKRLLRDAGLAVAPFITLTRAARSSALPMSKRSWACRCSLSRLIRARRLASAKLKRRAVPSGGGPAFEFDHKVVVEQGIKGREIECAVLGNDHPQASTCGEIVLNSEFYAYDTKYIDDQGAQVVVPAAIAPEINDKIALSRCRPTRPRCSGMACVDVFLTADNEVVINEIKYSMPRLTGSGGLRPLSAGRRLIAKPAIQKLMTQ